MIGRSVNCLRECEICRNFHIHFTSDFPSVNEIQDGGQIDLSGNYVTTAWKWGWGTNAYANMHLLWPLSLTSMQLRRNYRCQAKFMTIAKYMTMRDESRISRFTREIHDDCEIYDFGHWERLFFSSFFSSSKF